ncbi:hypothetical protein BJQ90_01951 [Arthrobacter sp. SO3]|nr:hypothetical protein [Arthrobacter sp. SO3]
MAPLVSTGVYSGPIDLTVEVLDARPEATAPGWEDIHELSLTFPEGQASSNQPVGFERQDVGTIVGDEMGSYRVRLHASGRDAAFDEVVESPFERHLVQFWKEPPSPVSVLGIRARQGPAAFHPNVAGTARRDGRRRTTTHQPRDSPRVMNHANPTLSDPWWDWRRFASSVDPSRPPI